MINIDRARQIKGWMDDCELEWLGEQAQKAHSIIELGSAYGRSTAALLDNIDPLTTVYCVDTWKGSPASLEIHHKDFRLRNGDEAFLQFLDHHWQYILHGNLIPLRLDGYNAAKLLQDKGVSADFIFIDADHDYEAVVNDILNFQPLLYKDGVFAGHDYQHPHWPGVTKAVNDLIPNAQRKAGWIWQA